jgi:hypothetical protein
MTLRKLRCTKCSATLDFYFLKNGICNGCRNPHLVVTAVTPKTLLLEDLYQIRGLLADCEHGPIGTLETILDAAILRVKEWI